MTEENPFTAEALAEVRARIGKPLSASQPFNELACKDAIRHFADSYGDRNPLYRDEQYARATKWGKLIAPPTFLYTCAVGTTGVHGGIKGAHALLVGDDWEWLQPVHEGDTITTDFRMVELTEVKGRFASPMYQQSGVNTYRNQRGEIVGTWKVINWRFARYPEKRRDRYEQVTKHHYTPEEIEKIASDYDTEEVRGSTPRYWEDVNVGDSLGHVVKGPLTTTDFIAWLMGGGMGGVHNFVQPHGFRFAYRRRHPSAVPPNEFGIPDAVIRVHWEDELARTIGAPAAYDFGRQRTTWMAHLVTNWMGDDAFLKKLYCQIRMPNIVTSTTWCRGKVARKYVAGSEHLADLEMWADDQVGRRHALAWATVSLPMRT